MGALRRVMVTLSADLGDSRTDREYMIATVSIHNGLVTILWSLALLIALAAAVRFSFHVHFPTVCIDSSS